VSRKSQRIMLAAIQAREQDAIDDLERMTQLSADLREALEEVERLNKMLVELANICVSDAEKLGVYASADTMIAMVRNKVARDGA
jgi:uncharacterized protein YgfB (UPF0149 family)